VLDARIHGCNVTDFKNLPENDRAVFLTTFHGLGLSLQTEREFIVWISEILCAEKTSLAEFPRLKDIEALCNDTAINSPQKIQKIRSLLHSLRFPRYDAALKNWNKLARDVNPDPSKVTLSADPYFEKNRVEVRVSVSNPGEASDVFKKLSGVSPEQWSKLVTPF
jgi:hypothetical protein